MTEAFQALVPERLHHDRLGECRDRMQAEAIGRPGSGLPLEVAERGRQRLARITGS